jgi:hypothetical protein
MKSRTFMLAGVLVALLSVTLAAQPFSTQIILAINQLVTGIVPFTALRSNAGSYMNWGTTQGFNGYGFRDLAGVMQVKSSGGSWIPINPTGSGDLNAKYIVQTLPGDLPNAQALGSLASAIVVNTTTTGVLTTYAGTSCTNQFPRSLSALGVATCATVDIVNDTTGALTVGRGGTGLTTGTSGGILGYTGPGTLASSAALTANALVLGGGAGATPTVLGSLGTTTTLLHGNAGGAPTFGQVTLTTEVTGILQTANGGTSNAFFTVNGPATSAKTFTFPNASSTVLTDNTAVTAAQGGTGQTSYTTGDVLYASAATTISKLADAATGNAIISGGVGVAPSYGKIGLTTHVSGTLGPTNGGTGFAAYTTGDLLYAVSGVALAQLNAVAVGQTLISQGAGVAPVWSNALRISTVALGPNLALSNASPTISSGFGTGPSVTAGTAASFRVNVGTGGAASAGVIGMPTAATGWNCAVQNQTGVAANRADQRTVQTASATNTVSVQNQTISTGAALVWTASDILSLACIAF